MTHWSARRLADWLRRSKKVTVSCDSIARLWRRFCLAPHRTEGFKFSTDPQLEAKVTNVVGLYLNPPGNAVVLCVDEKPSCSPPTPGRAEPGRTQTVMRSTPVCAPHSAASRPATPAEARC